MCVGVWVGGKSLRISENHVKVLSTLSRKYLRVWQWGTVINRVMSNLLIRRAILKILTIIRLSLHSSEVPHKPFPLLRPFTYAANVCHKRTAIIGH